MVNGRLYGHSGTRCRMPFSTAGADSVRDHEREDQHGQPQQRRQARKGADPLPAAWRPSRNHAVILSAPPWADFRTP